MRGRVDFDMDAGALPAGLAEPRETIAADPPRLRVYRLTSAAEVMRLLARAWHARQGNRTIAKLKGAVFAGLRYRSRGH